MQLKKFSMLIHLIFLLAKLKSHGLAVTNLLFKYLTPCFLSFPNFVAKASNNLPFKLKEKYKI